MVSIWTCSMCRIQVTFPGVEFLRTLSRFKKRKENSSLCVHVLQKTNHMHGFHLKVIDQWMSKKCTKKCDSVVFFFSHKTRCFLKLLLGHHFKLPNDQSLGDIKISHWHGCYFLRKVLFVNLAGVHHQSCPKIMPQLAQHLGVVKLTCCYNVLVTWRVLLHDPASKQLELMNMHWLAWMMWRVLL